jgi:hypothetical protein
LKCWEKHKKYLAITLASERGSKNVHPRSTMVTCLERCYILIPVQNVNRS